jgi:hypothetical protein
MNDVRYDDEDGLVHYSNEEDRALFEQIKHETGASIRESCAVAAAFIRLDLDPIRAEGPEFVWPRSNEPDLWWISPLVPASTANVCVIEALNRWMNDTKNCQWLLEHDDTVEATVRVFRNTISWLKFWSVRARSVELRGWLAHHLR